MSEVMNRPVEVITMTIGHSSSAAPDGDCGKEESIKRNNSSSFLREDQVSSSTMTDVKERQMQNVLDAVRVLEQFAALDAHAYHESLVRPSTFNRSSPPIQSSEECLTRKVEHLETSSEWPTTAIPKLARTIHQWHARMAILQQQEEAHAKEMKAVQEELSTAYQRNVELEKRCILLDRKTIRLTQKVREKNSVIRHARAYVRRAQEQQETLQEQNTVIKLQAHERILQRQRLGSADSNFSDVDAVSVFEPENDREAGTRDTHEDDAETYSCHSHTSGSSMVTDDGVAVLSLDATQDSPQHLSPYCDAASSPTATLLSDETRTSLATPSLTGAGAPLPHPASSVKSSAYALEFPCGKKTFLRIKAIPLEEMPKAKVPCLTKSALIGDDNASAKVAGLKRDKFRMPGFLGGKGQSDAGVTLSDAPSQRHGQCMRGNAFVISEVGTNFDETANPKPTLGARIVALDGQEVDPSWSLGQLLERLQSMSALPYSSDNNDCGEEHTRQSTKQTYSLSFRNDPLTKKHREALISQSDASSGGDKHHAFGLNFLKMGPSNSSRESHSQEPKPDSALESVSQSTSVAGLKGCEGEEAITDKVNGIKDGVNDSTTTKHADDDAVSSPTCKPAVSVQSENKPAQGGKAAPNRFMFWMHEESSAPKEKGTKPTNIDKSAEEASASMPTTKSSDADQSPRMQFPFWSPNKSDSKPSAETAATASRSSAPKEAGESVQNKAITQKISEGVSFIGSLSSRV